MRRLTGRQLEALTLQLDTPPHRVMAAAVGAVGTMLGVGLAGIREMRQNSLQLRYPQALGFMMMTAAVGTAGGACGHYLVVRIGRGPMEARAVGFGTPVGLATALLAWALTFYGRDALSPFEPGPQVDEMIKGKFKTACVVGPAAGVIVSLTVIEILKVLFYEEHPSTRGSGPEILRRLANRRREGQR
jgi:hypothetical protein